jgi:hypothetical protein
MADIFETPSPHAARRSAAFRAFAYAFTSARLNRSSSSRSGAVPLLTISRAHIGAGLLAQPSSTQPARHLLRAGTRYFGSTFLSRRILYDSLHRQNGFLFSNGNYTTLDDPLGINGTYATGISDASVIVGYYLSNGFNSDGGFLASIGHGFLASEHGSLASTVPEPSTWAMMLIGFAGIGFVTYRRTKKNTTALAAA